MNLGNLIKRLEKYSHYPEKPIKLGFGHPHSYRGYYNELAFEPIHNTTVGEMLDAANSAVGETFYGYKGGEYLMDEFTKCYLANYGCCGESIGPILLSFILEEN